MDKEGIKECSECGEDFCQHCSCLGGTCDRCDEPLCDDCNRSQHGYCSQCREDLKEREAQEQEAAEASAMRKILDDHNESCMTCESKYTEIDSFPCAVCSTGPENGVVDHYRLEIKS